MTSDPTTARDELTGLVRTALEAEGVVMRYEDRENDPPKTTTVNWARVTVRHNVRSQGSLSNEQGKRRFTSVGTLTTQIFAISGTGLSSADELSMVLLEALDGKRTASGVWLRNARMNEVGPSGHWFQVNVLADFMYDTLRG